MNLIRIFFITQVLLTWTSVMSSVVEDTSPGQSIRIVDDWHDPHLLAHEQQVNEFLGSAGLGIYRTMPPSVPGMHGTLGIPGRLAYLRDGSVARSIYHDLVGIAASPSPRVYCVGQAAVQARLNALQGDRMKADYVAAVKASLLPIDGTEKRGETSVSYRKLDEFEQAALVQLQSGHAYCSTGEGARLRGMGAIRAQASCLRCHDEAKEGDLLGAFTYFYIVENQPVPDKTIEAFNNTYSEGIGDKTHWERYRTKVGFAKPPPDRPYPADTYVQMVDSLWQKCGIIRDTHIQHVKAERADLERKHIANTKELKLYGWPPTATHKVKPPQKQ